MRLDIARLAVGFDVADLIEPAAAGTGDKLTHSPRIGLAIWILRCKAFVDVIVTRDQNACAALIENPEKTPHMRVITVSLAGAEVGMVPVRKHTVRGIGG